MENFDGIQCPSTSKLTGFFAGDSTNGGKIVQNQSIFKGVAKDGDGSMQMNGFFVLRLWKARDDWHLNNIKQEPYRMLRWLLEWRLPSSSSFSDGGFLTSRLISIKIVHSISRAVDVDARLARLDERSRHVQINDECLCDSCHARLGTKLFAMYPDDTIVCYKVGEIDMLSFIILPSLFAT
ncbi:hypothetical protein RJ639_029941 [Escallonia herrerae]|uniref:Vacuolar sorting protein 39/Transforming growth factor beta receptor-associated zinc finger domain-containing protein n=1 Tax=Escallonia herrerae TaxID=1293975 RepID=A0AA88X1U9_9ASTE|nr:hypothetical protein RJ639_029941 [Escallonia herrerae]